jgi:nitrite reductase/ring-hydroxylating ferredoxin subunit
MAGNERVVCSSADLRNGGDGVRFTITTQSGIADAFAIRFEGVVHAFLNRCAHVAMELDWNRGKFFDRDATLLICSTHGALYDPKSGACRGGPCRGKGLTPVPIIERDGVVLTKDENNE